jgi:hypothetical protein
MSTVRLLKDFKKRRGNASKPTRGATARLEKKIPAAQPPPPPQAPQAPPLPRPRADVSADFSFDSSDEDDGFDLGLPTVVIIDLYFETLKAKASTFEFERREVYRKRDDRVSPDSPPPRASKKELSAGWWESFLREKRRLALRGPPLRANTPKSPVAPTVPVVPRESSKCAIDCPRLRLQRQREAERRARAEERERVEREGGGVAFPDAVQLELLGFSR